MWLGDHHRAHINISMSLPKYEVQTDSDSFFSLEI